MSSNIFLQIEDVLQEFFILYSNKPAIHVPLKTSIN